MDMSKIGLPVQDWVASPRLGCQSKIGLPSPKSNLPSPKSNLPSPKSACQGVVLELFLVGTFFKFMLMDKERQIQIFRILFILFRTQ